jgi:hypothetical protein
MLWSESNTYRTMGISRSALTNESDNGTIKYRQMSYGNHDNVSKNLTGFLTQVSNDFTQGVSIEMDGICAGQGDSIVTANPSDYVYEVTRVNGSGTCTYHVVIFSTYNDTVKQFEATGVSFDPNTSHTIDPYFPGPNGPQVAILVDQGMTGNYSDTLFVPQVPLGVNTPVRYAPYIKVYPNPTDAYLNIDISAGQKGNYDVVLTDITGKILYRKSLPGNSTSPLQVPLISFKPGVYMLMITDDNGKVLYRDKVIRN